MRLTIEIKNDKIVEKIVWFLNSLKNQGVEIIDQNDSSYNSYIKELEELSNEYKSGNRDDFKEYIV